MASRWAGVAERRGQCGERMGSGGGGEERAAAALRRGRRGEQMGALREERARCTEDRQRGER